MTGIETAIAIAAAAAAVAGSATSMVSARQQAKFQSEVAARNAEIERNNAVRETHRSQIQQQEQDIVARAMLGDIEAQQASSGLSINESGSFALARKGAEETARLDALNIRHEGEMNKYNALTRAMEFDTERSAALARKRNATVSGAIDIGSSIIGGAEGYMGASKLGSTSTKTVKTAGPRGYTRKF